MRIGAPPTRRHSDTTSGGAAAPRLWLAAFAALGGTAALGQSAVPCTAIDDDAERLACYDRALRPAAPSAAVAPAAAHAAAPQSAPVAPAEDRRERRVRESTAAAPAAPAAAPAAPAAPRVGLRTDGEVVPIVIVGMRGLPGRETTFTAEDGTTWVQTDSQRVNVPDTPFAAELKPGVMGSYFLVPSGSGRAVRVRQSGR